MLKRLLLVPITASWLIMALAATPAAAHSLWLNLYESMAHPPGHVIASIGWGHMLPMDDLINKVKLGSYTMTAPDGTATPLPLPATGEIKSLKSESGSITIDQGDMGVRKFTLGKDSAPGTYQVSLVTRDNFYTKYLDAKGRTRWTPKPMDQVKEAKKILGAMNFKAYAKAYFTLKKWSEPKPRGDDLEIIPLSDLSKVRAGDKVEFKVLFMGKPLSTSPEKSIQYLTAQSNTFGGPDGFALSCIVFGGKASFRFPTAGQWMLNIYHRQDVAGEPGLKHLAQKCTMVMRAGTLCFMVRP